VTDLFGIFITTLIAEDASLVLAAYLIAAGNVSASAAFSVCALGIGLGDFLLYVFGRFLAWTSTRQNWTYFNRLKNRYEKTISKDSLSALICISRFIPGTRLPTYIGAGVLSFNWVWFLLLTAISVLAWVGLALFAGAEIYRLVGSSWIYSTLLILLGLILVKQTARLLVDPWKRKGFFYSFEKWLYFEFWPAYLFYLPVIAWYAILSVRYRNPFLPLYSNPGIENGGMVGESKWDLYRPLMTENSQHWLKTKLVRETEEMVSAVQQAMTEEGIELPFVLKPDKGQRGYGVRVIRNYGELERYFDTYNFDVLLQELCPWSNEAGIFYYRLPGEQRGRIFSITDKKLPFVIGDGRTQLGDLVLRDKRARLIADTYFMQLRPLLETIPDKGQKVSLTETGNHCRGAIFTNGETLCSAMLIEKIESIFNQIPEFYFGRFDIRYESPDALRSGEHFKIVELNGASSEATHIWDRNTPLFEAYRVLFEQWSIAFEIGNRVRTSQKQSRLHIGSLAREWIRMLRT
jgi:membrane protein DedA with SNARE-associated domain